MTWAKFARLSPGGVCQTPADSGRLLQTPADSAGLSLPESGGLSPVGVWQTLADSGRLRQTPPGLSLANLAYVTLTFEFAGVWRSPADSGGVCGAV